MKCAEMFDCCHCGGTDCGCGYCFSCKACEHCLADNEAKCIHSPDPEVITKIEDTKSNKK